jgi:hypothetical protein
MGNSVQGEGGTQDEPAVQASAPERFDELAKSPDGRIASITPTRLPSNSEPADTVHSDEADTVHSDEAGTSANAAPTITEQEMDRCEAMEVPNKGVFGGAEQAPYVPSWGDDAAQVHTEDQGDRCVKEEDPQHLQPPACDVLMPKMD